MHLKSVFGVNTNCIWYKYTFVLADNGGKTMIPILLVD